MVITAEWSGEVEELEELLEDLEDEGFRIIDIYEEEI